MKYSSFCAANSGEGFISFFDTILDEKKHKVYYIKGGPGSGKSTLLKEISAKAENAELIYCSGDPASLDGVILPDQNAVIIDATSPHSHEPQYPAVGGNMIDLGEGWTPAKMDQQAIIELSDQKKEIYKSCYSLLKSAASIHTGVFFPINKYFSISKAQALIDKILRQNALWEKREQPAQVQYRFLSGISPEGRITLTDSFEKLGKNAVILDDRWMISNFFLQLLDAKLTENGIAHINSYHPLLGKSILHHMIIPDANLSIVTKDGIFQSDVADESIIKRISIQSMVDKSFIEENKNKLAFIKRLEREILNLACSKLEDARNIHMRIEQEYAKGTDFNATAALKQNLINNLFSET
ncbi:MAG: hypothetical protein IJ043_06595 [Clostridia bacterium]|nr:hypothetical protein [Clostridia bacterium]